jgi:hypothetical protein
MEENSADERWITAHELRNRFGLTRYQSNTVSAFLRRLKVGPFRQYPFIVAKIAQEEGENLSDPKKCRYFLKLRECDPARRKRTQLRETTCWKPVPESCIATRENSAGDCFHFSSG